jgi:hypothetical protein
MVPLLVCLAGIFLGLRFKALILLPVSTIGSAAFIFADLSSDVSTYACIGDLLLALISLQGGYMLGLTGRDAYGNILTRLHATQSNRI